jgi:hypothetical protein
MHNIHVKDAINVYKKINRLNFPDYAKPFDLAIVNFTVKKINGNSSKKILQLSDEEFESYIRVLKESC